MTCDVEPMKFGFRIVGPCHNERRLVLYESALVAYCECDSRARLAEGGFLSPYQYDHAIQSRIVDDAMRLDVRGFNAVTWSRFLWFDIDDADLNRGLERCGRLASFLLDRYDLDDTDLLVFFSGSKGFHIGLPTSLWQPIASKQFARCCRAIAERLAASAGVVIDVAVYQAVQPFRAPNSRHQKTGLHKRLVSLQELERLHADAIRNRASSPLAFEIADAPAIHSRAVDDWKAAELSIAEQVEAVRAFELNRVELNRSTVDFIRDGAEAGDRHRMLYSASANLFEFGCPLALANALLMESALDSGLPPNEIKRAIQNAYSKQGRNQNEQ